jgi:hypothetical protein
VVPFLKTVPAVYIVYLLICEYNTFNEIWLLHANTFLLNINSISDILNIYAVLFIWKFWINAKFFELSYLFKNNSYNIVISNNPYVLYILITSRNTSVFDIHRANVFLDIGERGGFLDYGFMKYRAVLPLIYQKFVI